MINVMDYKSIIIIGFFKWANAQAVIEVIKHVGNIN
jgi:hypothetical protein